MNETTSDLRVALTPAEQMLKIRNLVIGCENQDEALNKLIAYLQNTDRFQERLRELESRAWVRETEFQSHAPVIGRLIVAVRNLWNWMSTKWYVLPMLQQQNNFNMSIVLTLRDLWDSNRILAATVASLQRRIETLENLLSQRQDSAQ